MAETWYAVYDKTSGELYSVGTVISDPLPSHLASVEVGDKQPTGVWNKVTKKFDLEVAVAKTSEQVAAAALIADAKATVMNKVLPVRERLEAATFLRSMGEI